VSAPVSVGRIKLSDGATLKLDPEVGSILLSRPATLQGILTLLEETREFMLKLGLRLGDHYQLEVLRWVDHEVEGWSRVEVKVALLEAGASEASKRGLDELALLEGLVSMAARTLPHEVRQEVLITVE